MTSITISCDTCIMQHTEACHDCMVTYLLGAERDAVVLDLAEQRAVRLLSNAGLVPRLRHQAVV